MVTSTFAHWPVLVVTIFGDVVPADVSVIEQATRQAFERREKHVIIFDCLGVVGRPDAIIRQQMAKFTNDTRLDSKAWTLGTAIIVASPVIRSVITAVHWVSPPSVPVEAVGTFENAIDRARSWLQTINGSLSVAATAALRQYGVLTASGRAKKVET